jgi:hypothetical protein
LIKLGITIKEEIFIMKRDMNLIRELLLLVEESKVELWVSNLEIDGYTDEEIAYNGYLMIDGGLAEGRQTTENDGMGGKRPVAQTLTNLTWEGHEFFDSIRNDSIWKNTLNYIKEKGGNVPFNLIPPITALFAKQYFGLP